MNRYEFSEQAANEILNTVSYISNDNPVAAENWLDRIEAVCFQLGESPYIGRERPELAEGLRSFPVGRFMIFYHVRETGVYIVHIVRSAMDIEKIFAVINTHSITAPPPPSTGYAYREYR